MAHISNISASKFTFLDYVPNTANSSTDAVTALADLFISNRAAIEAAHSTPETPEAAVVNVGNVREFPSMGVPANVVNVPVYGQATSSQVSGQSDAPSLDFTLNYIPADHHVLETARKNADRMAFRVRVSDQDITLDGNGIPTADATVTFDDFIFFGTIASLEVTPGLTDSLQASMTLTIEGEFVGPLSWVGTSTATYGLPA